MSQKAFDHWKAKEKHLNFYYTTMVTERNVIKKEADAEKENGRLEVTFETSGRSKKAIIGVLSALGALLAIVIVVKIYLFFKTE